MADINNDILSLILSKSLNTESQTKYSEKSSQTIISTDKKQSYIQDTAFDIVNSIPVIQGSINTIPSAEIYDYATEISNEQKLSGEISTATDENDSSSTSGAWYDVFFKGFDMISEVSNQLSSELYKFSELMTDSSGFFKSSLGQAVVSIVRIIAGGVSDYKDGIEETSFGQYMAKSWQGNSATSFLDYFKKMNKSSSGSYKINILKSTPLDSNTSRDSLFGTMILGTPYLFNNIADPNNRVLVNSLAKDCNIISLTPGMPKYYGSQYFQDSKNSIYNQTSDPNDMLTYLLRNGLDSTFSSKDKRYYTFEAKYAEYFSYLEAMLNPIWIKMGLANGSDETTFNIFSFFNIRANDKNGSINPTNYESLKEQYNSSIGFYFNSASSVSEAISNSALTSDLSSRADSAADTFQQLNYITGMGTGGAINETRRKIGVGMTLSQNLGSYLSETFTTSQSWNNAMYNAVGEHSKIAGVIAGAAAGLAGAVIDIARTSATQDFGSVLQSFETTNGMRVVYPNLWANSDYSKNVNFNLTFISPYGDPLSIFKYVYVPFCALLCFGLPRQASANGFVSPFFVRADVPGLITTDLGLISDITWTKGGSNNLWTKDGLPRAIDCTVTLTDLYPYLAMTKRMSFLSANPSYTVFLDNMAGLCKLNSTDDDDGLNEYFKELINRVNGEETNGNRLWNRFNSSKRKSNISSSESARTSVSLGVDTIPSLHNSNLN